MEAYGAVFRELRQQRQLSLKEVADDMVSISQLSRFERGESDITLSKLLHLLFKIKVVPTEFIHRINYYVPSQQVALMCRMRELIFLKDIAGFKALIKDLENQIKQEPNDIQNRLNLILFQGVLSEQDTTYPFPKASLNFLYDHLLSTEVWGLEELITIANLYRYFDWDYLEKVVEEVLKLHYYYHAGSYHNVIEALLINVIELSIESGKYQKAQYYLEKLEPLLESEHKTYHRVFLLYEKGFLSYSQGNENGIEMMQDAIKCFGVTQSTYHENYLKTHMAKWVD